MTTLLHHPLPYLPLAGGDDVMNVHPSVTLLSIRQRKVRALITPRALLLRRLLLLLHRRSRHHSMKGDGTGQALMIVSCLLICSGWW